jgi:hypothetical protein
VSFSYRIVQYFIQFHDSIQCAMCFFVNNQFRTCASAFPNELIVRSYEYAWVNIEFFTGRKKIKQRRISFVLGYLRMILWKISTAISITHRILATFNIRKKSILTAYMPLGSHKNVWGVSNLMGEKGGVFFYNSSFGFGAVLTLVSFFNPVH